MISLDGEYNVKLDSKGRIRIPSSLLKQLGDKVAFGFTVNRGFEKHLVLYPKEVWDKKTKEINQLNLYKSNHRAAIRYFHRGATKMNLDGAERILLPKGLIEYAGIDKEVVLFAYQDFVEIWSKENYDQHLSEEPEDFGEMMDDIFSNMDNSGN